MVYSQEKLWMKQLSLVNNNHQTFIVLWYALYLLQNTTLLFKAYLPQNIKRKSMRHRLFHYPPTSVVIVASLQLDALACFIPLKKQLKPTTCSILSFSLCSCADRSRENCSQRWTIIRALNNRVCISFLLMFHTIFEANFDCL